ncbi:hypothetical protein [Paenibacillus tyrfis]|uniref:Uncharacterized protein n=1 Tax=Paenibacillus tyrfis TaxID=1501230 RepID=A0A081NVW7_9BACL|nr:hypothetical protein [Paenibacillus tyrfis]KEQ22590.1 hypothetical protein ET33_22030 [Paenibacillus tyrfis]
MKKKMVTSVLALSMAVAVPLSAFATEQSQLKVSWSDKPQHVDWKPMESPGVPFKSYLIDKNGNKVDWSRSYEDSGEISTQDWSDGRFVYVFKGYDQSATQHDRKHFPIGSAYGQNNSPNPMKLTYTQQQSAVSTWTFTGKVGFEGEFGTALLAKAKASIGFEVSKQRQQSASSTAAAENTVSPWKQGEITAFHSGVYSGGTALYHMFDTKEGGVYAGEYRQWGDAWTVGENDVNYFFTQW